jgi:hypothetical protein
MISDAIGKLLVQKTASFFSKDKYQTTAFKVDKTKE